MTGVKEGAASNYEREATTMTIESLVVLGLGTLFLLVLGLYATSHREEDRVKKDCKDHHRPAGS